MLGPHGQRVLEIVGKDPSAPGIILPEHMAAAVQALHRAAEQEEMAKQAQLLARQGHPELVAGEQSAQFDSDIVTLRMRCAPLVEMLQRCERAGVEIVWGR